MKIKRVIALIGVIIVILSLFYFFPKELAWINQEYGLLISLPFIVLIPWLTSERWVEHYRLKREHSIQLAEKSLTEWKKRINEFTILDSKPNSESFEFEVIHPENINSIIYFHFLEEHLQKARPLILELWASVRTHHTDMNEFRANFLENMRQRIIHDAYLEGLELQPHYSIQIFESRLYPPSEYYEPDTIVYSLFNEIEYFQKYNKHWLNFEIRTRNIDINEQRHIAYELVYDNKTIFRTINKDEINILKKWFSDFSERNEFINNFNLLNEGIAELERLKKEFDNAINYLIWFVQLGNNLKGDCPFCPPGILSNIKDIFLG